MKYEKPFLTYDEQADLLISRGLMANREELVGKLERVGYYRFSGYLYPYKRPDGTYREGTTLDEVWGRYTFDRQFRLVVLDAIERVEVWFRSQLAYELSGRDGAFGLADVKDLPRLSAGQYETFMVRCESAYRRSKEPFAKHFESAYGDTHELPPYWMLVNLMDFGMVLTLFRGAPVDVRNKIAGTLGVSAKVAESWLVALNTVRNCCAHHSRLWNKTLGTKPMIPRDDTAWHEPHEVGNHKMFGTLTVLSYMLETIAPDTSWRSRLLDLMEERLPREEWRAMGFKDGWEKCPLWSKWLVNEKADESFNEESHQSEGQQD